MSKDTIQKLNIPLFDCDGKRIYLYSFTVHHSQSFLAARTDIPTEDIQAEITAAHERWDEYNIQQEIADFGKPFNELTLEELKAKPTMSDEEYLAITEPKHEALRKIFPPEQWDWEIRICKKFDMFELEPHATINASPSWFGGCMGD